MHSENLLSHKHTVYNDILECHREADECAHCQYADRKSGNVVFPGAFLLPHLDRGAALIPGKRRGKVVGGRAI